MSQETIREGEPPEDKKSQTITETIAKSVSPANPKANNSNRHSAAVPISLYREVAAELDSIKTKLSTTRDENRRLKHQNQILKQEIQYLLRSTPNKRKINRSFLIEPQKVPNSAAEEKEGIAQEPIVGGATDKLPIIVSDRPEIENFVDRIEAPVWIAETGQNFPIASRYHRAMNGWLLALSIVLIVGTAFTAGFFLVRPLIDSPNGENRR
jgi:hypothetical protein